MTEYAYSTDSPEALAVWSATIAALDGFLPRLREDIAALGARNPLVRTGILGSPDELVALEPNDDGTVPDGWRIVRSRLEPRRGKAGEPARQWLADHQPPDVRYALAKHGLPSHAAIPTDDGRFRLVPPMVFKWDGALWALFEGKPGRGFLDLGEECTWTPRKLSEFYAAREAFDAARDAEKAQVPA